MPVLKQIFDAKRDHRRCVPADVGRHFEKINHWVPEEEHKEFRARMRSCIEEGNAWHTKHTFLYYQMQDARIAHGIAIFGMNYPMEMLSLFIGVFSLEDHATHIIRFKLHPGKFLEEYKSLLTKTSIMRTHANPEHPLLIRVDDFRIKICKLLDDSGMGHPKK